ncbi:hypothetical protein F7R05_21885 [Pseudomonas koreensis]|nr:hypothetical protein F7R05_21885 [Pseudomonas koreensis]
MLRRIRGLRLSCVRSCNSMWRGSLLPLGCEAAPEPFNRIESDGLRLPGFTTASPPSGSKLPRHSSFSMLLRP